MLTKRTVLILGAGASQPFQFPIGSELSRKIYEALSNPGPQELLRNLGHSPTEISRFQNEFYYSGRNSIDAFLEHRPDLITIGKHAIAQILITYEQSGTLFDFGRNWLRYTLSNLIGPEGGERKRAEMSSLSWSSR